MVQEGSYVNEGADDRENAADAREDVENDGSETEHIKDQIEATRNQMGETIDAIQDRLSFSNISDQVSEQVSNAVETAKDAVYEATLGKAVTFMKNIGDGISANSVTRQVTNNPLPFILIGAGVGLLAYKSYSPRHKGGRRQFSDENDPGAVVRGPQRSMLSAAGDKIGGVTEAAGSAYGTVKDVVGNAYTGAGDVVSTAYEKAGEIGSAARGQYDTYIDENPLAVGAVALAVGAAVGMALPSTRYEGQILGNAREMIVDKVETAASDLIAQTKETVSTARELITDQAEETVSKVKDLVAEQAGTETAH